MMIAIVWSLFFLTAQAEDLEQMIRKTEQLYRASSSQAKMTMTIVNPNWKRQLKMEAWSQGDEKTLIRILSPKKEKGVSTLRIDKEMWNYFPKINKVIKVPPSMMMGSWMGSDFNNDDLVKQTSLADEYGIQLKKNETEWKFTLTPKAETTTVWGRIEIYVEPNSLLPIRYHYFNERDEKVRSMEFSEKKEMAGLVRPTKLTMINHAKKGQKTEIVYETLEVDKKFEKNFFSLRNLKK